MIRRGILRNLLSSLATKISVAFLNFLILVFTARYLGVQSRGEISIFLLNISVMQIINEVVTGYSLIYFIPRVDLSRLYRFGVIVTVLFCSAGSLIFLFLQKQVPGYEFLSWVVAVLVVMHTFNCVILLGKQQVRNYNLLSLLQPLVLTAGIGIFLFVLHVFTFKAYIYPLLFSFCAVFIISFFLVLRLLFLSEKKPLFSFRPVLVNGFLLQSAALMFIFANRYSFYLLPDTGRVGLYSSACSLMEAVLLIAHSISPVLAARVANTSNDSANALLSMVLARISFFAGLVTITVICLIPEPAIIAVLGNGFTGIRTLMILYAPAVLMAGLFIPIASYFSSSGKQRKVLPCYVAGFLVTLFLAPLMIKWYDVKGAAYTSVVSYSVMCAGIVFIFFREHKFSFKHLLILRSDFKLLKSVVYGDEVNA